MILSILLIILIQVVIVGTALLVHRYRNYSNLFTRKCTHACGGVSAALLPFWSPVEAALIVGGLGILILAYCTKKYWLRGVQHEKTSTDWGTILFPLGLTLTAFIFWWWLETPGIYQTAVLMLGIADAASGYVGTRFGKHRWGIKKQKTYIGSTAFFLCAVSVMLLAWYIDFLLVDLSIFFLLIPLIVTLTEAYSPRWLDNISVPVTAGILLWLLEYQHIMLK